jgi:hypothetical protein
MLSQRHRALNAQINSFLLFSHELEKTFEKEGRHEIVTQIRRYSSELADTILQESGLRKALRVFWMEKKQLANGGRV